MINTKALREKILDLAMRGKLVEQKSTDGSASVLLEKITEEKNQLVEEKNIKKEKIFSEVSREEIPFVVPENWEWVRIGQLLIETIGGGTPNKSISSYWNGSIPWASVKDLKKATLATTKDTITEVGLKNSSSNYINKDNLIIATRMAVGKIVVNKIDLAINQDLRALIINDTILKKYFFYVYPRLQFETKGITVKGITINELLNKPFALPPLEEQKRIIAKIEELFTLFDIIDANQIEYSQLAEQLDKKILDLAMRGKLVQQDPTDEPASVLLDKIKTEKERLIKDKKIKKEKLLPDISKEEIPFEIPKSWKWVRIGEVVNPQINIKPQGNRFTYIDIAAIDNKNNLIKDIKDIEVDRAPSRAIKLVEENDILFSMVRPYLKNIAIVPQEYNKAIASSGFYIFKTNVDVLYSKYMFFILISDYVIQGMTKYMKGDNSPSVNKKDVDSFIIPLPPIEEQKRIVTKLERIRNLN